MESSININRLKEQSNRKHACNYLTELFETHNSDKIYCQLCSDAIKESCLYA